MHFFIHELSNWRALSHLLSGCYVNFATSCKYTSGAPWASIDANLSDQDFHHADNPKPRLTCLSNYANNTQFIVNMKYYFDILSGSKFTQTHLLTSMRVIKSLTFTSRRK